MTMLVFPGGLERTEEEANFGDSDRLVGKCRRRQTNLETEDIGVEKHPDLAAFFRQKPPRPLVRYREPEDSKLVGAFVSRAWLFAWLGVDSRWFA